MLSRCGHGLITTTLGSLRTVVSFFAVHHNGGTVLGGGCVLESLAGCSFWGLCFDSGCRRRCVTLSTTTTAYVRLQLFILFGKSGRFLLQEHPLDYQLKVRQCFVHLFLSCASIQPCPVLL
jgi:hypothetical protein